MYSVFESPCSVADNFTKGINLRLINCLSDGAVLSNDGLWCTVYKHPSILLETKR